MEKDWILDNIKQIINEKGLKVENISKELGISKGEFSKIINAQRKDYIKHLPAIADVLKVGYTELLMPRNKDKNYENQKVANEIYIQLYERLILQYIAAQEANSSLIHLLKESNENYKRKYLKIKDRVEQLENELNEKRSSQTV